MDLRQLTIFLAAAKLQSFTKAAASLHYVQSNITAQIHALEEEIGVPLFDRLNGKQVVLTDAGRQLVVYAERLLDLATEARTVISKGGEPQGTLKIGATPTLSAYRLPTLLRTFRTHYPQVHVIFRPMPAAELRSLVHKGSIDVAFVYEEMNRAEGPGDEILSHEPICLLSAPDHVLVARKGIAPSDLEQTDLLLSEAGCCYRDMFARILSQADVYPATTLEFNNIEAVKQCVMAGLGVTVLPEVVVATEITQGALKQLPWTGPDLTVVTHLVWHRDKWLSPAIEAFLSLARQAFARSNGKHLTA